VIREVKGTQEVEVRRSRVVPDLSGTTMTIRELLDRWGSLRELLRGVSGVGGGWNLGGTVGMEGFRGSKP
jgi:hypothetical protein